MYRTLQIGLAVTMLLAVTANVRAHDAKAWEQMAAGDSRRSDWFTSLHASQGDWCCDFSDSIALEQDHVRQDEQTWFVFLDDDQRWVAVPADRVVKKPSIDGTAFIFLTARVMGSRGDYPGSHYPLTGSPYGIRCFVPPIPGY